MAGWEGGRVWSGVCRGMTEDFLQLVLNALVENNFLYIHLAKCSEFSLFPELGSIENLCENDFIIFF